MDIRGIGNASYEQIHAEVQYGAKFVQYTYVISFVVLTLRLKSDVFFIPRGQSGFSEGILYSFISLIFGWWGFPFGLIATPIHIIMNCVGGTNVTANVMRQLYAEASVSYARVQQFEQAYAQQVPYGAYTQQSRALPPGQGY